MDKILSFLHTSQIDWQLLGKAAVILAVGFVALGCVGRVLFGNRSNIKHSISSAFGILFIYALTVVFYSMGAQFQEFIAPLPFITFQGTDMSIFSLPGASYDVICFHILSMVILAFLSNLIDTVLPQGEKLITWFLLRCVTVVLAMVLHLVVSHLVARYLPDVLVNHASVILLGLLVVLLMVSVLKLLVGIVLTTVHPLIGVFYTFFFATVVGKALSKACLTTALLTALVYALNHIGVGVLSVASGALMAYVPLLGLLLALWYFTTKVLMR